MQQKLINSSRKDDNDTLLIIKNTIEEINDTFEVIATGATTMYNTLRYELLSEATTGCIGHYISERSQTIVNCRVGTTTLPSGSSLTVDIRKNGSDEEDSILESPVTVTPSASIENGFYSSSRSLDLSIVEGEILYVFVSDLSSVDNLIVQVVLQYGSN